MQFRPCIDIHNGKVKQIVGASLQDSGDTATENFVSEHGADYYASLYKKDDLFGGHVILLNSRISDQYEATKAEALKALRAYPGGLQVGGGITSDNAEEFLDAGASHVIVTSYVFQNGRLNEANLKRMTDAVGKEHLVLDLSCKKKDGCYYIVTDRWQNYTDLVVNADTMTFLASSCAEFLIHAADVEGKQGGIDTDLVSILASYRGLPVTYAGGVRDMSDLEMLKMLGGEHIHITIGSALDLFGGKMSYREVVEFCK